MTKSSKPDAGDASAIVLGLILSILVVFLLWGLYTQKITCEFKRKLNPRISSFGNPNYEKTENDV